MWVDNSVLFVDNNLDTIFRYRDMVWGPEITLFRYPGGTNIDEQRPPGVGGPAPTGWPWTRWGACWSRSTATGASPAPSRTGA